MGSGRCLRAREVVSGLGEVNSGLKEVISGLLGCCLQAQRVCLRSLGGCLRTAGGCLRAQAVGSELQGGCLQSPDCFEVVSGLLGESLGLGKVVPGLGEIISGSAKWSPGCWGYLRVWRGFLPAQ